MTYRSILMACTATLLLGGTAQAATLVNGSLDGPLANSNVPTGWIALVGTPDTNNQSTAINSAYSYGVIPQDSTDGGTWVGFGNYTQFGNYERFGQTISDFVIGQDYTLSWEAVNTSIAGLPAFDNTNGIAVLLDTTLIGTGGLLDMSSDWTAQDITFTATSTSHLLSFAMSENVTAYLQIDGVSLSEVAPVPVPAGLPLLLSGLGGLAFLRRHARS